MGLILTLFVVAVAVVGPVIAPHSATGFVTTSFADPSREALLGGDVLGRDILSRVLAGGLALLAISTVATGLGVTAGAAAGVAAAYLRGWTDGIIMRTVDVVLALPGLVFALLLVSVIGPRDWLLVVAVAVTQAPRVARVIRSAALSVSERDHVKAVELLGVPRRTVIRTEILPNLVSPLMVEAGLRMTYAIVALAGLSFIGFGLQPPAPNWGSMISENKGGLVSNPWAVIAPGLLLAVLAIGVNMFTDAITRVSLGVERPTGSRRPLERAELADLR
jgi:peptide/nickel transport system permease protein